MHKSILSCDWGTSSFRLRLVETSTGTISEETTSQQGIAKTFASYQQTLTQSQNTTQNRVDFYFDYLQSQIQVLSQQVGQSLSGIPVVISGMASSSIGIQELSYASLPFSLDGSTAFTNRIPANNTFPHDFLLISGIRSEDDVMRGEETQLIGLADTLAMQNEICIFPGTHSKHMYISNQQMTGFHTYMTGELFQTIASQTILRNSVEKTGDDGFETYAEVFRKGVITAANQSNLLNTLFTIRTGELFKKLTKEQNYYYLSGLLIGYELAALKNQAERHITLCSANNLLPYYQTAIDALGFTNQTYIVSGDIIDTIAVAGHLKMYKTLLSS